MLRILTAIAAMFVLGSAAHAACLADVNHCPADTSWDGTTGYDDDYNGAGGSEAACAARPQVWRNNCGVGTNVTEHYSQTFTYPPPGSDTTAPSQVSGLSATATSQTQIDLAWSAATDNVAVTGYKVYRGGSPIVTLGNVLTYSNTGLTAGTAYSYQVAALDAAGNEGTKSTAASATTQAAAGGTAATMAQSAAWVTSHFTGAGVTNLTGTHVGVTNPVWPSIVHDANCHGAWYCYETSSVDLSQDPQPTPATDKRAAFVNVNVHDLNDNGTYAAGILTLGGTDWDNTLDTWLVNVQITPNYRIPFTDYTTTNWDGITFDGGWQFGHIYASDVTINGWDDAAFDVKPGVLQCVRCNFTGNGLNTIKLWWFGPHYIVDSHLTNTSYTSSTAENRADGGIIWTWYCHQLVLNVYNSTFNGSPTIPSNWISCQDRTGGGPIINYLTVDPRTTGEMHPMFTAP